MDVPFLACVLLSSAIGFFLWDGALFYFLSPIVGFLIYAAANYEFTINALKTFPRDFCGARALLKVKRELRVRVKENRTLDEIFVQDILPSRRLQLAMVSVDTGAEWTFEQFDQACNQVAAYFHSNGLREGDVVALDMQNCPEFVVCWFALCRIGVVTAWINHNLRDASLAHCINIAKAKAVVCDADLQGAIGQMVGDKSLENADQLQYFVLGPVTDPVLQAHKAKDYANGQQLHSKLPVNYKLRANFTGLRLGGGHLVILNFLDLNRFFFSAKRDVLCYIYTSGTTGLPKAAMIKHARYYFMSRGLHIGLGMKADDKVYVVMPMYHSAAGILGVGQMLLSGSRLVIRKKFSASRFWDDCVKYGCTTSQYIGEVCRYLLAQPNKASDTAHSIRLLYGNGIRPDIWVEMQKRFKVPQIGEFYGSTEGNSNIVNTWNYPGAVGFVPIYSFAKRFLPVSLIKVNETTGEIIRDSTGMCIQCKAGETGQMVGKIVKQDVLSDFTGYVNSTDTSKKVVRDVFTRGDAVFSSGDLLHLDHQGYLYFKDRTGDTFRWKGENVSTTEVETVLHGLLGLSDATVYGVEIPGTDGRAGMAAIVDENSNVDMAKLGAALQGKLPAYARPVLIRTCKQVEQTGTFKLKKTNLQKEGYSLEACAPDVLYYLNTKTGNYEKLTEDIEHSINQGKVRF